MLKKFSSPEYNYIFDMETGYFIRWGKTETDDPQFSPYGPEILDIEISVNGCMNQCKFCYKSNTNKPATNMSLEAFKHIIDIMPRTLTQVAFGITGVRTNPHFIDMMKYCRQNDIIPNFTLSGIDLTDELAKQLSEVSGAIAVSAYKSDKNVCYDTVKKFSDLGIKQTNIHLMVSGETKNFAMEVLKDITTDPRLKHLNAVVFLSLKPKGRASTNFHPITTEELKELINYSKEHNITFGFDSCSAPKVEEIMGKSDPQTLKYMERCESSLFSGYVNVKGEYWHCSFAEHEPGIKCVDLMKIKDRKEFYEIWTKDTRITTFRNTLIKNCRNCIIYKMK